MSDTPTARERVQTIVFSILPREFTERMECTTGALIVEIERAITAAEQAAFERGCEEGHKQGAHDEVLLRKIFNEECDSEREQAAFRRGAEWAWNTDIVDFENELALRLSPPQPAGGGE